MQSPISRLLNSLSSLNLDAMLVSDPANISYLTGLRSRDAWLLVSRKESFYLTDARYTEEAALGLHGITLRKIKKPLFEELALIAQSKRLAKIGFEEHRVTWLFHKKLQEKLKNSRSLVPAGGTIEEFRKIKTAGELQKIRQATRIACETLEFCRGLLTPGIKELEAAAEIERFMRYNGAYGPGFDIIVASGPNSSRPHHATSSRKLQNREPVIIDLGVDYQGYNSDLTRTFFLGKMTPLFSKVYAIANEAQRRAIAAIRPQVFANKVDTCARQYITRKGYGGFFTHSLGHGVGLEVHEAPRISGTNCKDLLKTGMVFTVEPGIYLPGRFGVRIEDMVLVTRKGCEVLSGSLNQ